VAAGARWEIMAWRAGYCVFCHIKECADEGPGTLRYTRLLCSVQYSTVKYRNPYIYTVQWSAVYCSRAEGPRACPLSIAVMAHRSCPLCPCAAHVALVGCTHVHSLCSTGSAVQYRLHRLCTTHGIPAEAPHSARRAVGWDRDGSGQA
jgi:hypothetical protein